VELSVWTRESRSCCCSTQGNSAIWAVECSVASEENLRVTFPSWIWQPGTSSVFWTFVAFT